MSSADTAVSGTNGLDSSPIDGMRDTEADSAAKLRRSATSSMGNSSDRTHRKSASCDGPEADGEESKPSRRARLSPASTVRGILDGRRDQNGLNITRVYARSGDLYAIYLAGGDVLVHLADDTDLQPAQRRNLSEVADNRWELDRLADGWRHGERYHRELASSLGQALEGDFERANVRMRDAIFELSKLALGAGRLQYVLYSAGWALAMLGTLYLFSEVFYPVLTETPSDNIWLAGKAGVVGAFMSIAFGIRNRTVAPDNDRVGNALESGLRMSIGLFGAGFLLLALKSGIIGRVFVGNDSATGSQIATWHATVTLGFVCGFLERLIPSLLERSATEARVTGEVANQANVTAADNAGKAAGDNKAGAGQGRSGTPPGREARPEGGQAGPAVTATPGPPVSRP